MLKSILTIGTLLTATFAVWAGPEELNRDRMNEGLQGTMVLRVNQLTGEASMLEKSELITSTTEAEQLVYDAYIQIPSEKIRSELDQESGSSSWYWYNPNYTYGAYNYYSYYYYGNCYNPWYSYSYGGYSYYYYNRFHFYR